MWVPEHLSGRCTEACEGRHSLIRCALEGRAGLTSGPGQSPRYLPRLPQQGGPTARPPVASVSFGTQRRSNPHGTRSLPMCPGTRRPRSCPRNPGNPGVSTTAGPPASSTRVQEQEWRRSVLLGSRTVARVIGTRPVKACGGLNLGVVGGSLN